MTQLHHCKLLATSVANRLKHKEFVRLRVYIYCNTMAHQSPNSAFSKLRRMRGMVPWYASLEKSISPSTNFLPCISPVSVTFVTHSLCVSVFQNPKMGPTARISLMQLAILGCSRYIQYYTIYIICTIQGS